MRLPRSSPLVRSLKAVVLFAAILIAAAVSEANEHEAAPAAGGHEAAGEGAKAEKPGASKAKAQCRYSDHESRLTSYMAKIRTFEKEISDMIASKHHIESGEKIRVLTQQISFKHSDLAKVIREYEEERLHVRFQHPDHDMEGDRKYTAQHLKSLDEIEQSFGLDGRLDRIRKQVTIVFPAEEKVVPIAVRRPASAKPEDSDDMPSNIRLVK